MLLQNIKEEEEGEGREPTWGDGEGIKGAVAHGLSSFPK